MDKFLSTEEVSEMFGISKKSLANSRNTGTGIRIPYVKIGKLVRYKESDIEAYVDRHSFHHTGEQGGVDDK